MKTTKEPETCPCKFCGVETRMTGTKLCDPCWEIQSRIGRFVKFQKAREFLMEVMKEQLAKEFLKKGPKE